MTESTEVAAARLALAEWYGADTDVMSAGHALADALRTVTERLAFLEENRIPVLEADATLVERALAVDVFPGHAEEALDDILSILGGGR
jgi:hypothetical protein